VVTERREVVERRLAYDTDAVDFVERWAEEQIHLQQQIVAARARSSAVLCSSAMLDRISTLVCEHGVVSLRADLAIARASCAQAALLGADDVTEDHIDAVLPLALAHRAARSSQSSRSPQSSPNWAEKLESPIGKQADEEVAGAEERRFSSMPLSTPELRWMADDGRSGATAARRGQAPGPVTRVRKSEVPAELDLRSSVRSALTETGQSKLRIQDLYEKVREPLVGSRFLFVVDSSGSHAARERMRAVKGAVAGLVERSLRRRDEVAVIVFRGESAEVLIEPTNDTAAVFAALEYLPTGGRTPLAHALELAQQFVNPETLLLLLTDGRANVPSRTADAWADALEAAAKIRCAALVVDTELSNNAFGKAKELANVMHAEFISLASFEAGYDLPILLKSGAK
jgi:magnesium chelatase subunit D